LKEKKLQKNIDKNKNNCDKKKKTITITKNNHEKIVIFFLKKSLKRSKIKKKEVINRLSVK
jgi:hypothetical protein